MKDGSHTDLIKIGLAFVLFGLLASASFFYFKNSGRNLTKSSKTNRQSEGSLTTEKESEEVFWDIYTNKEFGYSIAKPKLLVGRQYENVNGYLHFIRFEENKFSRGKGVAVGVSGVELEEQVKTIKESFAEDEGASLVSETTIDEGGKTARVLEYRSMHYGEDRVIVVLEEGDYTYSISTVPEQIEHVLANLRFL